MNPAASQALQALLAAGIIPTRELISKPGAEAVNLLNQEWAPQDNHISPDSQEANEQATLDARRPIMAVLTWQKLEASERTRIVDLLQQMEGDQVEFLSEIKANLPQHE